MIDQKIDAGSFKQLKAEFRQLDRDVQKETKNGIKKSIGSVTSQMQGEIEGRVRNPPMSGMGGTNKLNAWRAPAVKPSLRLSAGAGKPVAMITASGKSGYTRMFAITERAGSRSSGFSERGKRMISVLEDRDKLVKGKGGRYAFRAYMKYRPLLHDTVERELNGLARRVNVRLKSGS
jgi:hypothetical protein